MTAFAVLHEERPTPVAVPAPRSFRFSDVNPLTERTYAQSRFRHLPDYVVQVIEDRVHLCAGEWDVLVEDGEVYDFVGPTEVFECWVSPKGWTSRHFPRPGLEVVDLNDSSGAAWF
jgi:hypothetical protein